LPSAVPLNIGYAQIAGLPPTAGLYALVFPAIVYALLVSSRQVVASPDAAAAALVASSIGGLAVAVSADYLTMAFAQAIICGALFALAAVFKLGFLANFLSKPILVGFVGGLALDILISQIAKMLGVKIDSGGEFVEKVAGLVAGIPTINGWSGLISAVAVAVAVLLVGRRFARVVPWALVVLIFATVVIIATGLEQQGVAVLGPVDAGPPTLTWPILDWGTWLALVPSATSSRSVRRTRQRVRPADSRWARRPPAPRRWIRSDRARSCLRSSLRSGPYCYCCRHGTARTHSLASDRGHRWRRDPALTGDPRLHVAEYRDNSQAQQSFDRHKYS
jgi:Sulfate permease family